MPSIVPLVKIKLDKVRHLRLDLNAMVAYERASGESISLLGANMSMAQIRILLWACLLHEDEDLTLADVGGMVYAGNLAEVSEAVAKTANVAQPTAEGDPNLKNA